MLRFNWLAVWVFSLGVLSPVAVAAQGGDPIPGRYIIRVEPGIDPEAVARQYGLTPDFVYRGALHGFAAKLPEGKLRAFAVDRRLMKIEPDRWVGLDLPASAEAPKPANWGVDRIDQRSLPMDGNYEYDYTGQGVTAFIMDTGIRYQHGEFGGRARPGFDAFGGDGTDCNGHGSHVAGIVGGETFGVAKEVSLVSVRILNCGGSGSLSAMLAGIDWVALNHRGPSVANLSLVSSSSEVLDDAIRKLIASGVTVITAAGNNAGDACQLSPGRLSEVITVGATDARDRRAYFSNFGDCVSLFAPGREITSVGIGSSTATKVESGTSMATPHAAGVAALLLEHYPRAKPAQIKSTLLSMASQGVVANANSRANHLLYSLEREVSRH